MNSLFQQARGFRTLSIGLILIAIYGTYALLTGVFLNVERHGNAISRTRPQRQKETPSDFRKPAELWFREDPWVAEAGKRFRDGQRIVYTQNITLLNDNHAVKVEPVAMLWEQKGETEPVTMTAASARFEASSAMMKDGLSFGRITRGALLGDVRIRGPHGLRIDGHNFNISDDSLRVYSSAPVTFAWEDHTAFAQDGIEIQLVASDEETEKGLVSVNNIQWIRLNGRVECDLMLDNKNPRRESTHIRIDAKNGFEFFVPTQTATFLGPRSQKPTRENQIVVTRPLPTGQTDRLFCTQLTIQLKPEIQAEGVRKETPSRLALDTIRAEGNRTLPVVFQSEQENVIATMTTLTYHVDQQQLELQNTFVDPNGRPFPVRIQQEGSELLSPWILVFLGESGSLQSLECRGPGLIRHSEKAATDSLTAAWNESFMFINNSLPKLIFRKNVQIAQPSQKFSLSGELVEVELTGSASAEESTASDEPKPNAPDNGNAQADSAFALGRMKPQRIIARDQVKLIGEQMSGLAREQLTVTFSESPANGSFDATAVSSNQVNGLLGTGADGSTGFTHFDADTLEATMVVTEKGSSGKLSNVWLKGSVSVDHTAVDQEQSFNATGNVLRAETGFQTQRQISLFGEPAVVVSSTRRIEGQRIDIDPEKREVTVEGSGRIRLVADRDFAGRTLRKPSPLDIYWGDRMTFSGRVARFFGKIRAVMNDGETHDMELTCAGMEIQFAEDVVIRKTDSSQNLEVVPGESKNGKEKRPGIQEIRCESLVKVRIDQLIDSQLDAQHEAEFSDLVVNFETGNFAANGPGWIRSTQPDRGNRMKVAPGIMARANTPVRTTENAFVYVETEFIGSLSGNVNDRIMRLKQHVTGVFGPVRALGERINVSTVSTGDLPARTGILRCEELTVAAVSTPVPGETSFTLEAERNARLESNLLSGDADRITYDHVKEQFILRATRESPATVFHRPGARGEVRSLVGQRFEYYPTRDHLVANEISGVQGSL